MKNLYLIRHGKTIANEERRYCGFSDLSLSSLGLEELKNYKEMYSLIDKDSIFITSGMKRCNETLNYYFGNINFSEVEDLKELNFGDFELHTHQELVNNPDYNKWISEYKTYKIPNGESSINQRMRVVKCFKELLDKYKNVEKDVVIVCHGGTIFLILDYLFCEGLHQYILQPKCGCGYKIDLVNKRYQKIEK